MSNLGPYPVGVSNVGPFPSEGGATATVEEIDAAADLVPGALEHSLPPAMYAAVLAKASGTDGACLSASSTTFTSAAAPFTAAMVGSWINITAGTNFTVGRYLIVGYSSTSSVTLLSSPLNGGGNGSSGVFSVVGNETNLYWRNCLREGLPQDAKWVLNPNGTVKGVLMEDSWKYTPINADVTSGNTKEENITFEGWYGSQKFFNHASKLRIAKSTAGPTPVDVNLLSNPGFETGDLDSWTDSGNTADRYADPRTGSSGSYCARVVSNYGVFIQNVTLSANTAYTLKFWHKNANALAGQWYLRYHNGTNYTLLNSTGTAWVPGAATSGSIAGNAHPTWTEVTISFTTPPAGVGNDGNGGTFDGACSLAFGSYSSDPTADNRFDDVTLQLTTATKGYRRLIMIGDSTGLTPLGELKRMFALDTSCGLNFAGTRWGGFGSAASSTDSLGGTQTGLLHECYSGLKMTDLLAATWDGHANPFYQGGAFNFASYLTANGVTMESGDWVLIHLGLNDCALAELDGDPYGTARRATMLAALQTLVTSIIAVSGIRVGICLTIPPASSQDAAGNKYGTLLPRTKVGQMLQRFREDVLALYGDSEANGIYIVPIHAAYDTVNNSASITTAVNARNTATTVTRQSDMVHPGSSGYWQIADAIYAFLKYHQ